MNIQAILYGLNRNATTLQLDWGFKPLFDDVLPPENLMP